MKRWTPFFLWFGLFWPALALAEFCWRQGAGGELFTDSEGVIPLILLIVWLVLLFQMRPDNEEESEWDDDDESETPDNTLITVYWQDDPLVILSRTIYLSESPEHLNGRMVLDNDPVDSITGTVMSVFQVLGNDAIVWRVNVMVDFLRQFERLENSNEWDIGRISDD